MPVRSCRRSPRAPRPARSCADCPTTPSATCTAPGLFRMVQPARVGGADLDVGILVDTCAEIARVCPSTAWNLGNLASHHWMLGYFRPEAPGRDLGRLARRADRHVARLPGRPRPQGRRRLRGLRPLAAVLRRRQFRLEHAGLHGARARRRPAGRPALRLCPSLAVRDHRHLACGGPRRHRLEGRGDQEPVRAGVPNDLGLGDERQAAPRLGRQSRRRCSACPCWRSAPTSCRA